MKNRIRLLAVLIAGFGAPGMAALADDKPDCSAASQPKSLEGQIVKVDPGAGKLSVRDSDGTTHEFLATREILQEYKVGDSIKAGLRLDPRCNPK